MNDSLIQGVTSFPEAARAGWQSECKKPSRS